MKYSIEIECTEKCRFRSGDGRFMQSPKCHYEMTPMYQFPDCVGLSNKGCPFQEESCDTCDQECSRAVVVSGDHDTVIEARKVTHCSAYRRAK